MTRKEILDTAEKCVNGERQEQYGTPENNFQSVAGLWQMYLSHRPQPTVLTPHDVAIMMALLKIARIASGQIKDDNYVDLAGYAACAGEIATHG